MKRINNPPPATLRFDEEALPAMDFWNGTTPDGSKAEYRYHQSKSGAWASRKVGYLLNTAKRLSQGLTRKQVEALFGKAVFSWR